MCLGLNIDSFRTPAFYLFKNLIFSSPTDNQVKDIGMTDFLNNKEGLESRIVASNILKALFLFRLTQKKLTVCSIHYNNQFNDEFGHQSDTTILSICQKYVVQT